jgi:hypothetical protein
MPSHMYVSICTKVQCIVTQPGIEFSIKRIKVCGIDLVFRQFDRTRILLERRDCKKDLFQEILIATFNFETSEFCEFGSIHWIPQVIIVHVWSGRLD